jgi:hypothetical protein
VITLLIMTGFPSGVTRLYFSDRVLLPGLCRNTDKKKDQNK